MMSGLEIVIKCDVVSVTVHELTQSCEIRTGYFVDVHAVLLLVWI